MIKNIFRNILCLCNTGRLIKRTPSQTNRDFLLEMLPKGSIGAEIGVHLGDFSREILDVVQPQKLYLIDPWRYEEDETYEKSWYGGKTGCNQLGMDKRYKDVLRRFNNEIKDNKVLVHRGYSHEIFCNFEDEYFNWVYIDGNHLYEFVKKDLELCYKKVENRGFIAGDDYDEVGWWDNGVKKAVDEFISTNSVEFVEIKNGQFVLRKI